MRSNTLRNTCFFILTGSLVTLALVIAATWLWFTARPQPAAANTTLFQGITYLRQVRQTPRPMVVHVVTVDLRQEGISFLVTPGEPKAEQPLKARTTSQFLAEFNLQLAVNGDGATPWYSRNLLDYYPHPGDAVAPIGLAASRGVVYSQDTDVEPTLYISRTNRASFNTPTGRIYNAISGNQMLVVRGKPLAGMEDVPQPRTAVALDKAGRRLILVVVDGRQRNYSEGASLAELAGIIVAHGGYNGMNLDGGGSTTLVIEGENGRPEQLNSPIDNQIPGRERPVGNHLGIYASR